MRKLDKLARENNIPLIIDNAYGLPFPNIIFEDVEPFWNENTILCMSLSKLGLPGVRCGIVIASEEITQALTNMNGIISLAPGSVGPALANHIIAKGDLLKLSSEVIKPFYKQKSQRAVELLHRRLPMRDSVSTNLKGRSSCGYGLMSCQLRQWSCTNA